MASINDADALDTALGEVDYLEESLLTALKLTHHGFSVELRFTQLRLGRPVPKTSLVMVAMEGVSALHLSGGLSESMVQHPERINWGLSEVARVSAYSAGPDIGLLIAWETTREIRVEAARVRFSASPV